MPVRTRGQSHQPAEMDDKVITTVNKGNHHDTLASPKRHRAASNKKNTQPDNETEALFFQATSSRANATHIFFWGGVLSNWCTTTKFSGARCLELLVPELAARRITHPSVNTFASRLLTGHMFNCGEQFMMAMKGWFFETDLLLAGEVVGEEKEGEELQQQKQQFERLRAGMYEAKVPKEWAVGSKERAMWEGTLCRVLRSKNPKQQKALGRKAQGFDVQLWSAVNMLCVTAACVARAEVDPVLKKIYIAAGEEKKFVEGSPMDRVWGVGIHWKESVIEDPALWMGENRLGLCHDEAARKIRAI